MKRIFLIVLDSLGVGFMPDAENFGDKGAFTLKSLYNTGKLDIPTLRSLGIGNIQGLEFLGETHSNKSAVCKLSEKSAGKDSTIGHWEIAGIVSQKPLPVFKDGFPDGVINEFEEKTGRKVLCNRPYSGTEVIKDYGEEHIKTGKLIVYTSADSVFQIAAHEDVVPVEQLWNYCKIARKILSGENAVGRVIARPFIGTPGNFVRTSNRKDFSLEPTGVTILDKLKENGLDVISIGKIYDLFAGRGITESYHTDSNGDGMNKLAILSKKSFNGLLFANLVDFDTVYGHRNNAEGYALALNKFDIWLKTFLPVLSENDILMITADHGCDPGDISTDHTREYIPLIVYGNGICRKNLGIRNGFSDIGATILDMFDIEPFEGKSLLGEL